MLYFYVLILIQIVVESFPISSSGHEALWQMFLTARGLWDESAYAVFCGSSLPFDTLKRAFDYALHGPTLVVIALFFFNRWWPLLRHYTRFWRQILLLIGVGACADILTAGWYLVWGRYGTAWFPLGLGFCITACILYSLRSCPKGNRTQVSLAMALIIGFVQGVALLPGISRMGITYGVGRWLGLAPRTALEFSLFIQYPLIAAGFLLGVWTLGFAGMQAFFTVKTLAVLCAGSVAAYYALRLTMRLAINNNLWRFAYYMPVPLLLWVVLR